MADKTNNRLVPLNFGCGSLIDQNDIDQVYKEAYSYPVGRERRAFLSYARTLEEKLKKQKGFDGNGTGNAD
ncbi:MAG TPA: hypothetical protein VMX17_08940 [Candidatus Glassbacteria bacterium]|nr:hypothetical protein [Candidatus Glassbacteria bacterium]